MRIAYLDCFSGISGDMFLGALVDAGVPAQRFEETVAALNIGAQFEVTRVERNGISAIKVDVSVNGEKDMPRELYWSTRTQAHEERGQPHKVAPVQLLEHNYVPAEATARTGLSAPPHQHEHGRGLKEIRETIRQAGITESAKTTAVAIFESLGAAEAQIHHTAVETVHFHEVGAVDALVDIVCAAVGAESLGADELVCSPLNVGGGSVVCAHGTFPVPAPATLELLQGAPIYSSGIQAELVTPTGAAIVKQLAKRYGAFPPMTVEKTGYGAGTREFHGYPNVVRLTIGEAHPDLAEDVSQETVTVLEANLDDLNPQVVGYVLDRLLQEGSLDAFVVPVQMKKNRPGMLLTVLCRPQDCAKLTRLIVTETTTLGLRQREEKRTVLPRKWVAVTTRWGEVRLKVSSVNGMVTNYAPEYEDCRRIASEHRVPLKSVMQEAMREYAAREERGMAPWKD